MQHPYCQVCSYYDASQDSCPRSSSCPWRSWEDGILYRPGHVVSGGTGRGFPALFMRNGVWTGAFLKAQRRGKSGGYSWEQTCAAFAYEASALHEVARRGCPNVPAVFLDTRIRSLPETEHVFFLMSFAPGVEWDAIPPADSHRALVALCEALDSLHQTGFGHYDLKPQNLRYESSTGRLTLLDFGSSKGPDDWRKASPTHRNHPIVEANRSGTVPFVSPEQRTLALRDLTPQSDTYVFGILFCRRILGWIPGASERPEEIASRLATAGVPPDIADPVATRALATNAATRHGALQAILSAMRLHGWHLPLSLPPSAVSPAPVPPSISPAPILLPQIQGPVSPRPRPRRLSAWAVAAIVVSMVGLAAVALHGLYVRNSRGVRPLRAYSYPQPASSSVYQTPSYVQRSTSQTDDIYSKGKVRIDTERIATANLRSKIQSSLGKLVGLLDNPDLYPEDMMQSIRDLKGQFLKEAQITDQASLRELDEIVRKTIDIVTKCNQGYKEATAARAQARRAEAESLVPWHWYEAEESLKSGLDNIRNSDHDFEQAIEDFAEAKTAYETARTMAMKSSSRRSVAR